MQNSTLLLPITGFYAGILGFVTWPLAVRVGLARGAALVSLGDGSREQALEIVANAAANGKLSSEALLAPDNVYKTKYWILMKRVRAHGNFVEHTVIMLILCAIAELNGAPPMFLNLILATFTIGRVLVDYAITSTPMALGWGRAAGMITSGLGIGLVGGWNVWATYGVWRDGAVKFP
ncbi:hypothetical protein M427DRAFT_154888 [Gonapodya prolifera JEL478]|uniref:Uncharacterized protein n=1 Tax=Gonapodya prolifera (strain JEL478) TaxID=1344416 RepID=A0A139AHB9_GONPJ|nr:hypothetical protein M427DRAFT_154888 [Gonapodya prolifera JEL478]|eukprot:KXS16187.1 hypothetical protein M427DRAFT_154888 [Gonapodya prolifera JEL478]